MRNTIALMGVLAVAVGAAACGGSDDADSSASSAAVAASGAASSVSAAVDSASSAAESAVDSASSAADSATSMADSATSAASSAADTAAMGDDSTGGKCGTTLDAVTAAAKAEGKVNLIALPDTWANYKGILDSFKSTYGLQAPVANPDASSADEVTAIKTLRGQDDQPDAVDVGPSFTQQLIQEKLVDAYKPSTWDEIPASLKDPQGYWVAAYYGVMSIGTNTAIVKDVPKTWADLKKPEYKGKVTINGDPREAGAAFAAVVAAALANGGSFDDIEPGIQYFADLKKEGNLNVVDVTEANVVSGEVAIALDWTYNFPGLKDKLSAQGFEMQVNVPTDGVYGGYYAQSVVSQAKHPCAARLWLEHLVGDDGALGYLKGGAIPARYAALQAAGKITPDVAAGLPSADVISKITFPTQAQIDAMKKTIADEWGPKVANG